MPLLVCGAGAADVRGPRCAVRVWRCAWCAPCKHGSSGVPVRKRFGCEMTPRPTLFAAEVICPDAKALAGYVLTKPAKAVFRVCGWLGGVGWAANRGLKPLSPPRLHTLSG